MSLSVRNAVLATLCYADLFCYPLKDHEVHKWLIGRKATGEEVDSVLKGFRKKGQKMSWYFLRGRKNNVTVRLRRSFYSRQKLVLAEKSVSLIARLPTVLLVGITGGLAMANADSGDDIDLLVITAKDSLWFSRLLIRFLSFFLFRLRKPGDRDVADTICLNMYLSEDALELPPSEHDLYGAHELLQLHPLVAKGDIYGRFLAANRWAAVYLPNAWKGAGYDFKFDRLPEKKTAFPVGMRRILEGISYRLQILYMNKKITSELVTENYVRFHPRDRRPEVMSAYGKHLGRLNIPLDKGLGQWQNSSHSS